MADDLAINGADDQRPDDFYDWENDSKVNELTQILKSLELEKSELLRDNGESKTKISSLLAEIESLRSGDVALRREMEKLESETELAADGKKALDSTVQKAVELETELFRLQHDLVSAMDESDQANKEVAELKALVEEKRKKVEALETEVGNLKAMKTEFEMRIRDLERIIDVLEMKGKENSEKVRVEVELREIIEENDKEIAEFKAKVKTLEAVMKREALDLEKWKKVKSRVDEELVVSQKKVDEMESKVGDLEGDLNQAEKTIGELKEKLFTNSVGETVHRGDDVGLKLPVVVVAGSTGAVALVAALAFICYARNGRS